MCDFPFQEPQLYTPRHEKRVRLKVLCLEIKEIAIKIRLIFSSRGKKIGILAQICGE